MPSALQHLKAPLGSLANKALANVLEFHSQHGSNLTGDALEATKSLLETLQAALNQNLDNSYYLSSLDPGIGKTLAVCKFLKAWADDGFSPAGGALIGVSRLEEIPTYLAMSGVDPEDVAVLTSDDEVMNALGVPKAAHSSAPIMFTTQQMIASRTRNCGFADASDFHFDGRPRSLRLWDESIMPAAPAVVSIDSLMALPATMRLTSPTFTEKLRPFLRVAIGSEAGQAIEVPIELTGLVPDTGIPAGHRDLLAVFRHMGGKPLGNYSALGGDMHLAGAGAALPADFAPAIVIDASARVRTSYSLWEKHRGDLVRLPCAANDYGNLTVHIWQRGCGQQAIAQPATRNAIADAVSALINSNANERSRWLIVHYKDRPEVFDRIVANVASNPTDRVRSLTWGRHHGTNDFADFDNVVILGQLNYAPSAYAAIAAAASGLSPLAFGGAELLEVQWGEYQHHLLQALSRASVRRSRDGSAGPCQAYLVTTPSPEVINRVATTFPGCVIRTWTPAERPMIGKVAAAAEYLRTRFAAEPDALVTKKEVREHLEMKAPNFSTLLKHEQFQEFMYRQGIWPCHSWFESHPVVFEPWPGGGYVWSGEE